MNWPAEVRETYSERSIMLNFHHWWAYTRQPHNKLVLGKEGNMMVGRFQVMALLQAARAQVLGYPLDEAKSFGLNRAIFYAAAKRGFRGGAGTKHPGEQHQLKEMPGKTVTKTIQQDTVGGETAYYVE